MKKQLRLISLPNVVRNSENKDIKITSKEIGLSVMLLSNKFGTVSKITMGMLEEQYNLSAHILREFNKLLPVVDSKGLVKIDNYRKDMNKHTVLKVREAELEAGKYVTVDYNLIEKILLVNKRIDSRLAAIYILIILQSRAGYKDTSTRGGQKGYSFPSVNLLAKDTNLSKDAVLSGIQLLEDLKIIEVVRQGKYITTGTDGIRRIKEHSNVYIVIQVTYTKKDIEIIKQDIKEGLRQVESKAFEDKMKSYYIDSKTGDEYNKNRPMEEEVEMQLDAYGDYYIEKTRIEREKRREKENKKKEDNNDEDVMSF